MKCFFEYIRSSLTSDQMYRVRPYVCRAFGVLYTMLMLLLAGVLYRIPSVPGGVIAGVLIGLVIFFRYISRKKRTGQESK